MNSFTLMKEKKPVWEIRKMVVLYTPALAKIINLKNARAWVSMVSYLKKKIRI